MPLYPISGRALAKTTYSPASAPLVIHSLRPFRTQWLPSWTALVASAKASEPLPASESA